MEQDLERLISLYRRKISTANLSVLAKRTAADAAAAEGREEDPCWGELTKRVAQLFIVYVHDARHPDCTVNLLKAACKS